MPENTSQPGINATENRRIPASVQSETQPGRKYRGDITSKEAGDMVKNMIREQEKLLMSEYEKNNKVQ